MNGKKSIFIQELIDCIIMITVIVISLLLMFAVYNDSKKRDTKNYNNGICTECGGEYRLVAVDRGYCYYECEECKHTISVIN